MIEQHPFEPFLPSGTRILFLGSFPPQAHRWCMPFYYPNWINDFWRIMGLIHFGDQDHFCVAGEKRFDEAAIRSFCAREGLAFYDTACEVRRLKDNASDAFLEVVTPTDIPALLARIPSCLTLVTTGQKATELAAEALGCPIPPVGGYIVIETPGQAGGDVMPGPSSSVMPGCDRASHPLRFWRMPSTSRAYPLPLEQKAAAYRQLFAPKLVLFDLDGTLLDTLEDLAAAVNHALALRGLPLHSVEEYRRMVGHGVRNLVAQALEASLQETPGQAGGDVMPGSGAPVMPGNDRASLRAPDDALIDAALADFKEFYSAHIDERTRPYPGIPELLADLHARGIRMAVASNKFQAGTERLIRRFFPGIPFVAILGDRPGSPLKPSPEIVREVLTAAGLAPQDALLVGDSPTDMRTAANGGIPALAVTWGYRSREELAACLAERPTERPAGTPAPKPPASRLIDSVKDLRRALLGEGQF